MVMPYHTILINKILLELLILEILIMIVLKIDLLLIMDKEITFMMKVK